MKHGITTGITYGVRANGLVPLFEEYEAMHCANCNLEEWRALNWREKALHVAHYRLQRIVKMHGEDAVNDKLDREAKKIEAQAKKGGRG